MAGEARDLVELGTTAMDLATRIDEAEGVEELRSIGGRTRGAVEEFIDRASVQVT